jgi:hypothetical protein
MQACRSAETWLAGSRLTIDCRCIPTLKSALTVPFWTSLAIRSRSTISASCSRTRLNSASSHVSFDAEARAWS